MQHTAAPYGHAVLPCGDVKATQFHFMLSLVRNLEKQRRTAHQKQKYGADGVGGGWTGFSRSPDFIQGVLLDALEELRSRAVVGLACGQPDTGVEVQTATGALGRGGASSTPRVSARETQPRGGFTDVGHHTGADVGRDTAWPLVREVLQVSWGRADRGFPYTVCLVHCKCCVRAAGAWALSLWAFILPLIL